MERQLKSFWVATILLSVTSAQAGSSLEDWIRRLTKPAKYLTLTSTKEETKLTPKLVSFKGSVKVPSYMVLLSGSPRVHNQAGQFIVDGQVVCNYSPRSSLDRYYVLSGCSDGTRGGEEIYVQNKIEVKLLQAASTKASLTAKVVVVKSEAVEYGINFPYIKAEEGQVLMYNGEAWIAADAEELGLSGVKGEKGDKGDPGEMGPQGPAGYAGAAGVKGDKGDKGDIGDKGDKGDKGDAGVAGAQGPKGDTGAAGATGPQGPAGAAGSIGAQGPKGDSGAQGPAGVAGAIGPQGPKGDTGAQGPQGPAGAAGAAGAKGDKGDAGPQGPAGEAGPQGPAGVAGATGSQGPQGPAGERGLQGPQGAKGDRGEQGPAGEAGAQGAAGVAGPMGLPGAQGPQGPAGAAGAAGAKGDKGDKGDRGLSEIAYLRDERASGQNGGSCSSAAGFQTRTLNVLGGDTDFISLANNRFTLQPGKYFIEALVPALQTNTHQAKLRVIESNIDVMIGSTSYSAASGGPVTHSVISGEIVVTVASTFEIQHRCATDRVNTGFGMAAAFGIGEVYTQVKIIKKQ